MKNIKYIYIYKKRIFLNYHSNFYANMQFQYFFLNKFQLIQTDSSFLKIKFIRIYIFIIKLNISR